MSDDRGVSVTLNYVILLAVATTVLVASVIVVSGVLDSQLNHAVQDELTVTGESLASELEQTDRLYRANEEDTTTLTVERPLPTHISGRSYRIIVNGTDQELTLRTIRPDTSVTIAINATTLAPEENSIRGGPVEIALVDDELEVREA